MGLTLSRSHPSASRTPSTPHRARAPAMSPFPLKQAPEEAVVVPFLPGNTFADATVGSLLYAASGA